MAVDRPFADPAFLVDPYPVYARLRSEAPVVQDAATGDWIVTGYAASIAALGDGRLSSDRTAVYLADFPEETRERLRPFARLRTDMMLFVDPPKHTRLRGLVNRAFTPRVIEALRPRIAALVDEMLAPARERGEFDVIADLAEPLPGVVIAELLGVPPVDRPAFKRWSDDFVRAIGGAVTPQIAEQAQASMLAMKEYLRDAAEERRVRPGDDLLSGLVATEAEDDRLTEDEVLATCALLLFAGNETTTNLIGNGILALLRHRDQWDRLRAEPTLIRMAVEEFLRYDSPVQGTVRVAAADLDLGDAGIGRGARVSLMLAAANRDPAQFPEPDKLDVARGERRHLAFGLGPHFCLGAALARLEGQIAIAAVVEQFPALRLMTEPPDWKPSVFFRGLRTLPVACWPSPMTHNRTMTSSVRL
ncbi:MAG TPA: cytochrome P450 [Thermomicrobiales bacterium]